MYVGAHLTILVHVCSPSGIFCATGYVAVVMHGGSVSSLWGPPPKPAGDYSLEEDQAREAMFRRRRAVIAAKEKAAELKAQVRLNQVLAGHLRGARG